MKRTRLKSVKQLEREYKEEIETYYCENYFEFILHCYENSSSPKTAFNDWYKKMTIKDRKMFCIWLLNNVNDDKILSLAILDL